MGIKIEVKQANDELARDIQRTFGLNRVIAIVLSTKVKSIYEAFLFLYGDIFDQYSPFEFNDIEKTVERLRRAIKSKELIAIYGDRDADGSAATVIMYDTLRDLGANVIYRLPTIKDKYGLSREIIDDFYSKGVKLLLTVDCGISNYEEVNYANSLGIDVIITDHHEVSSEIPKAYSIVNPKCPSSGYPYNGLSGFSVAFKICIALLYSYTPGYNRTFWLIDIYDNMLYAFAIKNLKIIDAISFAIDNDSMYNTLKKRLSNSSYLISLAPDVKAILSDKFGNTEIKVIDFNKIKKKVLGNSSNGFNLTIPFHTKEFYERLFKRLVFAKHKEIASFITYNSDLAAITTIVDIMPLDGENRLFVKEGLSLMQKNPRAGIMALMKSFRIGQGEKLTVRNISWQIGPVLNAPGRVDDPTITFELLLETDENEAKTKASNIIKTNNIRKKIGKEGYEHVKRIIDREKLYEKPFIFVYSKYLEPGICGIVASKIANEFNIPSFIISLNVDNNSAIGSVRTTDSLNIVDILSLCDEYLLQYGGHKSAAGFLIDKTNIEAFYKKLLAILNEVEEIDDFVYTVDAVINANELSLPLAKEIDYLAPFGHGNKYPLFLIKNMRLKKLMNYGSKSLHLMLEFTNGVVGMFWNAPVDMYKRLVVNKVYDVIASIEIDNYFRNETLRLNIKYIKEDSMRV